MSITTLVSAYAEIIKDELNQTEDIEEKQILEAFIADEIIQSHKSPIKMDEDIHPIYEVDEKWLSHDLWLYCGNLYGIKGGYSETQKKLLILDFADKERQKFERLQLKFSKEQTEHVKYERTRIPENVRTEVWRRDEGKCAGCGSRVNLEYDHIVPVSRGGSNTARNVELLCEVCNRSKGDRIQ